MVVLQSCEGSNVTGFVHLNGSKFILHDNMRHNHKYFAILSIYYKKSTYKRIIYKPWNKIKIKKNKTEQFGFSNAKSEIIIVIISSNK